MNAGKWEGLQAASPKVLMQLLQRWFQAFEQPIVSAAQQTAVLAALDTYSGTAAASTSANDASQDTKQAAVGDLVSQHELPGAASQCSTEACAAAIGHLPIMQRLLIDRIVKGIIAVTEQDQGVSSRQALMPWLAKALTEPYQLGTNSVPSMEQQALLSVLEHYAGSGSSTVQRHDATPLQPALNGMVEAEVVTENKNTAAGAQAAMCYPDPCARVDTHLSVAADSGPCDKIAAHLPGTTDVEVENDSNVFGKPDAEVEHSVEHGCMWLHKKVANMVKSHMLH